MLFHCFCLFVFSLYFVGFNKAFVENVMKKLPFSNTNFQNSMKDLPYYKKSGSKNFRV